MILDSCAHWRQSCVRYRLYKSQLLFENFDFQKITDCPFEHGQPNNFRLNNERYSSIASSNAGQCTSADVCFQENSNWSEEGRSTVQILMMFFDGVTWCEIFISRLRDVHKTLKCESQRGKHETEQVWPSAVGTGLCYTTLMLVAYVCVLVSMLAEHKQTIQKEKDHCTGPLEVKNATGYL